MIAVEWAPAAPYVTGDLDGYEISYAVGRRHPDVAAAVAEGTRLAGGTDDFLVARLRGDLLLEVTGASGRPLKGWSDEDDYQPLAKALGATWLPKRGQA